MTGSPVVRVPATSANLGAGFDVFGMALDLYADIGRGTAPHGAQQLDEHHPAAVAHVAAGGDGPLWLKSAIPMGRGLGFSGAMRVGGAALALIERAEDPVGALAARADEILDVAVGLEGHGDNAAASLAGGIIAWSSSGSTVGSAGREFSLRVGPRLQASRVVVWIPDGTTSTDRSRSTLPALVDRVDVVHNLARVAQFAVAIERDDPTLLVGATADRIHQTIRFESLDDAASVLAAGVAAGAWCGWLSGSGPTLAFLTADDVADSVIAALPASGHTKCLRIAVRGTHVVTQG